jgi:predicted nucleotide-binding protein
MASAPSPESPKQQRISQSLFPSMSLFQALRVAQAIWDELAGEGGRPIDVAAAMKIQPSGGAWRSICGAAIAFGLTEGGYNASEIKLLPLGRRCVAPEEEGDDAAAMVEAFLKPTIIRDFLQRYDGKKFPGDQIGRNVLISLGLPKDRAESAYSMLIADGEKLGILQNIKGERYVNLAARRVGKVAMTAPAPAANDLDDDVDDYVQPHGAAPLPAQAAPTAGADVKRVFITHGKDKGIREQIEEIVKYGGFTPVVSVKTESLAKPVPHKVLDEMRSCDAAVIHVNIEQRVTDDAGNEVDLVNQNVLIEIGAAMALYGEKFVLLVEEGAALPSNLQGLYECRYSGSELSMTATMKLLKAFNEFKSK